MLSTKIKMFFFLFVVTFLLKSLGVFALTENIDGLTYDVKKIDDPPIEKNMKSRFDLYELFFENKSSSTFSIPGYSIDLGVDYSSITEINSLFSGNSQKKMAVLNLAAGAASIALSGIAKNAANTVRSVSSLRKKNIALENDSGFLSGNKTYILYPDDSLSLLFFVNKNLGQVPNTIRFICRNEELNIVQVIINNKFRLYSVNAGNNSSGNNISSIDVSKDKEQNNVISAPTVEQYK